MSAVVDPSQLPDAGPTAGGATAAQPSLDRFVTVESVTLTAILALAFILRMAWLTIADARPYPLTAGDPFFYDRFAAVLAAGEGFLGVAGQATGHFTAQWPPGYPAVLAVIFKLFGHKIILAKLLNVALGTATCFLTYLIGKKVFNAATGLAAAAILALFPSQVFQPTLVMSEVLATFLVAVFMCLVAFLALDSLTWRRAAAAGALIGVITFVRGETILLAAPLVVVWAMASRSWLTGLRYGAIALAATAIVVLPWVARNWVRMGYPILMSTGSGENLIAGHWPGADGKGSFAPILEVDLMYESVPFPDQETLVYKEETQRAVSFAVHNPAAELKLIPKKLFEFYRADGKVMYWIEKGTLDAPPFSSAAQNRWEALANAYYWAVLALVAAGIPFWLSLREPRRLLLLMVVLYYSFLFGFVFIGEQRFHTALLPLFSIFAAVALLELPKRLRAIAAQAQAFRDQS